MKQTCQVMTKFCRVTKLWPPDEIRRFDGSYNQAPWSLRIDWRTMSEPLPFVRQPCKNVCFKLAGPHSMYDFLELRVFLPSSEHILCL